MGKKRRTASAGGETPRSPAADATGRVQRARRSHGRSTSWNAPAVAAAVGAAGLPLVPALNEGGLDPVFSQYAAAALWWAIALAVAFGVLPRSRLAPRTRLVVAALVAVVAWTLLALTWTESAERTTVELARVLGYAGVIAVAFLALNRMTWRAAAGGLLIALMIVPALALAARLFPEVFTGAHTSGLDSERLSYPLGYWNALACWSAMALAGGLAWSAHSRGWQRGAALAAAAVAGTALYLTYSRGGLLAAGAGVAMVLALSSRRATAGVHAAFLVVGLSLMAAVLRSQPEIADASGTGGAGLVVAVLAAVAACCFAATAWTRRLERKRLREAQHPPARPVLAAALALLIAAAVVVGPYAVARLGTSADRYAAAGSDPALRLNSLEGPRGELWASALRAAREDPVTGIGPGTFEFWWTRDVAGGDQIRDAHSLYLETLAELGPLGLAVLVGLLVGLLARALTARRGLRRAHDIGAAVALLGIGAVFVVHAAVDWLWEVPAVAVPGLGALAIAAAATSRPLRGARRLTRARLAFVGLAVAAGLAQIPGAIAAERVRSSRAYLNIGVESKAAERAREAERAEPWAAGPYAQSAFVALVDGRLADAGERIDEAIEREPTNWRHRFLRLRIDVAARDRAAALASLDDLIAQLPVLEPDASALREAVERQTAP